MTTAFQPAATAARVHPAAPLLRALAAFVGVYVIYRLTGALADGVLLLPAGTRGAAHTVALTQPFALAAFGLSLYPGALILGMAGAAPRLLGKRAFVNSVIGAVVLAFVSYVALSFYL